ncbi:hypothetical protein CAF53_01000 [Sphingobium sp. LB126]|uniref:tetratricopeptide repeat protein n=1 Tax=Sphingobium sp. LB126 TaxID=1983755 RepID=UPI000C204800|nr:tetratricopeptide repeat protein [Sphingobium sp. LB126]PJG46964.1 hypothetical protein CAF53_01000 [Sphingobium sp. LB126]
MILLLLLAAAVAHPVGGASSAAAPLDYPFLMDEAIDGGRIIQAEAMLAQWRAEAGATDRPRIDIATARLALEKRRDGEAAAQFTALINSGMADCRVDEGLGIAMVRLGQPQQALEPLRRAVAACADRWRAWNALAVAYDHAESWALSSAAYERAFQLTNKPEKILNNYGLSLLKQRQADKASAIFDKAHELVPDDAGVTANRDAAYVLSGRDIRRSAGDSADTWARRLSHAGQVALQAGDRAKAQAYLSRAVTEADNFVPEAAAALASMENGKR